MIDVSFNAAGGRDVQGVPSSGFSAGDLVRSFDTRMSVNFITATAAARVMIKQGSGVTQTITAPP